MKLGKKMTSEIKLRMISAKDSEIKIYEENISKYSSKAVEVYTLLIRIYSKAKNYYTPFANSKPQPKLNKNVNHS